MSKYYVVATRVVGVSDSRAGAIEMARDSARRYALRHADLHLQAQDEEMQAETLPKTAHLAASVYFEADGRVDHDTGFSVQTFREEI